MQLSALQIFFFALAILAVAMLALVGDTFKRRRRRVNKAKAETAARLSQPTPPDHAHKKIQPIDGMFSKRRSDSKTWPANPMSIVHAGPRIKESPSEPLSEASPVRMPAPQPKAPDANAQPPKAAESKAAEPKTQTPASTALILPPVTVDALLWERLLALPTAAEIRAVTSRTLEPPPTPSVDTLFEVVCSSIDLERPKTLQVPKTPETPTGMIEESVLKEMLVRTKLFTGLVVSIGLNEPEDGVWRGEGLYQSITNFVGSVLGKGDFGCRTAIDEFLVVVPGKQESDAQNHLNYIADRLWDFQLRGIGACAILFSWGGATAEGQSLSSAIASATQRMRQAKQRRNPLPVRSLGGYRRAN
jgi:Diguanylate cyclase, GGDEF domain